MTDLRLANSSLHRNHGRPNVRVEVTLWKVSHTFNCVQVERMILWVDSCLFDVGGRRRCPRHHGWFRTN